MKSKKIVNVEEKNVIVVVYDKVSTTYGAPSTFINNNVAVRSFADLMCTDMYKNHKGDYDLIKIGTYDNKIGEIVSVKHEILSRGVDFGN